MFAAQCQGDRLIGLCERNSEAAALERSHQRHTRTKVSQKLYRKSSFFANFVTLKLRIGFNFSQGRERTVVGSMGLLIQSVFVGAKGMVAFHCSSEGIETQMCVFLSGDEAFVSKKFLKNTQVDSTGEKVSGIGMSEGMRV